jgi:hypothetical protein
VQIACTIAHLGHAITIDRPSGESTIQVTGLQAPHGLSPINDGFVLCDTQRGRLLLLDKSFEVQREVHLSSLGGKNDRWRRDGDEWLQAATQVEEGLFLLVDGARNCLWLIDVVHETFRRIGHPIDWRVHRAVTLRPGKVPAWWMRHE